ncbi:MAG: hypothetical protein R2695_12780 [Acidimicrobiales bacterium]
MQLCLPIAADQWENADAIARVDAGVTLEPHERDADTIGRAIDRLLGDDVRRDEAARLAGDFAAMPHPAEIVASLEALV